MELLKQLQQEFKLRPKQVENTVRLIDEGNTIPFIARYRKELTGSLDDQLLRELNDRLSYLRGLEKRREEVMSSVTAQEKMTDALALAIQNAKTLAEIEDLYRPFKQKRKTRASAAKEKGLEPLAEWILSQQKDADPEKEAQNYCGDQVQSVQDAVQGAKDIIAELVSDSAELRKVLRSYFYRTGRIVTRASDPEAESVYTMYYEYQEPVNRIAGHRVLAIDRGEREGFLKVGIEIDSVSAVGLITSRFVTSDSPCSGLVRDACEDSYSRLLFPSLEREIRALLSERASEQAIKVFSANLQKLLMQPPVKDSVTLGLDPAYRTGCKIAVVDGTGKVLETTVIYPTPPQNRIEEAKKTLKR